MPICAQAHVEELRGTCTAGKSGIKIGQRSAAREEGVSEAGSISGLSLE